MKDKIKNIWKSRAALMVDQEKERVYVEMTEDNFNEAIAETVKLFAIRDVSNNEVAVCKNCKYFKGETYHDRMYCRDCRQKDRFLQTDC